MMSNYNELEVWKKSHKAVLDIYRTTNSFPMDEKFGIVSQLRRAAVSIPTNIAEGSGRIHIKEYIQFIAIARGSAMEVEYLIKVSKDLNYITEEQFSNLTEAYVSIIQMLNALIISLKKKVPKHS
ncbi:four helix bundle protein [Anaerosolibacter sp.]|uniref:four helix bundle protein n=1 Tax=Anaerosolibacter sp. TaxID=1872527 RepID=UPI0039F00027